MSRSALACTLLCGFLVSLLSSTPPARASDKMPTPGPKDTCPVCGMFVSRYPEWIALVQYEDGVIHFFDGAKDLYKYLLDRHHWAPDRAGKTISRTMVTEYYSLEMIDAASAWYVIGSDVLGPMGHELIPLASREAAAEFLQDHKGVKILKAEQITLSLLRDLDRGKF